MIKHVSLSAAACLIFLTVNAQTLTLKDALNNAINNYESIKAKTNYMNATEQSVAQSKRDYLPNFTLSAQQDFGTVNGQNGPLYGFNGLGVASSGLPLATQNWNAGFGALYLANINWEFFTFGKAIERIKIAEAALQRDVYDLEQEKFQHQIKVASAYLNLLAAQSITKTQQKNLERTQTIKTTTTVRAINGLVPGVDTSLANSEVANATIALIKAIDNEQEQASKLALLMGVSGSTGFVLDTTFINKIPSSLFGNTTVQEKDHPLLKYYQSKIDLSSEQEKLFRKAYFPSFAMFGIIQDRASGFSASYTQNQNNFTQDYMAGVTPTRGNYLIGVGMNWNLTAAYRANAQVNSQHYFLQGVENEYNLVNQQLKAQIELSEQKIKNSMAAYTQVPVQLKAASDAYLQKSTMYKTGLATIVDVTQTLYVLNRAETDRAITYSNVWQALLLKAAATGDIQLFTNEF